MLDSSGSVTSNKLLNEELFRSNLFESLPGVSLSIYHFASHLTRMTGPTRDPARIRAAFEGVVNRAPGEASIRLGPPYGPSLIYEAVAASIQDATRSRTVSRKLVVAVSDGFQNGGAASPEATSLYAQEAGIPVYPVVVGGRKIREAIARAESEKFASLGERTGGVEFRVGKLDDERVKGIIGFIADRVCHLYVVGYTPEAQARPRRRKVEVRLQPDKKGKLVGGKRFVIH